MNIIKLIIKLLKRFNDWGNSVEYNDKDYEEFFWRRI